MTINDIYPVYLRHGINGIKWDNIRSYDGINGITPYKSYPVSHLAIPFVGFIPSSCAVRVAP